MNSIKRWLLGKLTPGTETQELLRTIRQFEQEIQLYREADKQRGAMHQKLKVQLEDSKQAAKLAKEECRTGRKALAGVKLELEAARETLTNFGHLLPHGDFGELPGKPPARSWVPGPQRTGLERRAWRDSMRLGVLHQHTPRPFSVTPPPRRRLSASPPVFSIVTPSWQQADYLEHTLKSVLNQRYPSLQYIVMDGGSTDGSKEIIERHADRLTYWQSTRDGGQSSAIQSGFAHASGEIMAWLNSDDVYLPNTLAYVADYFERNPAVDAVYGHRALINEAGHELGRWYLPPHDGSMLLWADYIPQETLFWRRRIYEKCGGIDSTRRFAMDWDLLLRMQRAGAVFHRLPEFLACFRVHESQKSQAIIHDVGAEEGCALRQRELGPHFNSFELARRCTAFQLRALRTKRLWELGIRSVRW